MAVGKPLLFGQEIRISWAFQKEQRDELGTHFHVFVGDLGPDVTDSMLLQVCFFPCVSRLHPRSSLTVT